MSTAVPVIADVDTGVDDALALLFLVRHAGIDLRAVTAVAGNVDVDTATRNTRDVLALAGASAVPVARGAERPLINLAHDARAVHGDNGVGNIHLPTSGAEVVPVAAPELIKQAIEDSADPITLLGLGPLTNIALFLRSYPEQARALDKIVFMGGSAGVGNATAVTEFNAWHDPEATSIVINSGVPVIMYGLDVFYRPAVSPQQIAGLEASDDPVQRFAGGLLSFAGSRHSDADGPSMGPTLGDAGAAYLVADPDAVTVETYPVQVVLAGAARGQTMVDRRGFAGEAELHGLADPAPLTGVAMDLDVDRVVAGYLSALGHPATTMR